MDKTDFVHIGYSFLEEIMRIVVTMPVGFSYIIFETVEPLAEKCYPMNMNRRGF